MVTDMLTEGYIDTHSQHLKHTRQISLLEKRLLATNNDYDL